MAGRIENYSKFEVCMVVRFLQAEGVSQSEIHRRLVSVYGQKVFRQKEVSVVQQIYKAGRMSLNDDPQIHRGRPRTSHTDENCVIGKGLIREDRRIRVREIAEVTGIANHLRFKLP
jgi:hypothetical protein